MNISVEIFNKPQNNIEESFMLKSSSDVLKIKDVLAIRNAIREHLIFIGLDGCNNLRNVSLLGIGSSKDLPIDTKEIIRMALLTASDKVILVHNHPSKSLKPSQFDLHITYRVNEILKPFNIELLDHIIITENNYMSMKRDEIYKLYREEDKELENMDKGLLIEENKRLKEKLENLEKILNNSIEVLSAKYIGNYNDITVYSVEISLNGKIENIEIERNSNLNSKENGWKIISDVTLDDKEKDYIIQTVSENPPVMLIDEPKKIYNDNLLEEIGMGE